MAGGAFRVRIQHRAESGENSGVGAVALIVNDESHGRWRQMADVASLHHVLLRAQSRQLGNIFRMLQGIRPRARVNQVNRDRLLRFDVHLDVAAVRAWSVRVARMIIGRVHTHGFGVGGLPLESALLRECRSSQGESEQQRKKACLFHGSDSISAGSAFCNGTEAYPGSGSYLYEWTAWPDFSRSLPKHKRTSRFRALIRGWSERRRSRGDGLRWRRGAILPERRRCRCRAERLGGRGRSNIARDGREWGGSRF